MSRSGDEMMLDLYNLLNKQGLTSTAAKEDDKGEEDKKSKDEKPEENGKKDDDKKCPKHGKEGCPPDCPGAKKNDKKAVVMGVINELTKLASDLDNAGADEASAAVDDALRLIVKDLTSKKKVMAEPELFEEEYESPTGREEGMGTRTEYTLQEPGGDYEGSDQPKQELTPEGLGMEELKGDSAQGLTEDKMDRLLGDPEVKALLRDKLKEL